MLLRPPLFTKLTKTSRLIRPILTTRHFRTTPLTMGDDQPKIITAYPVSFSSPSLQGTN